MSRSGSVKYQRRLRAERERREVFDGPYADLFSVDVRRGILWRCEICQGDINDGDGYLLLGPEALRKRWEAAKRTKKAPPRAQWQAFHSSCKSYDRGIQILVEQVRGPGAMLDKVSDYYGDGEWVGGAESDDAQVMLFATNWFDIMNRANAILVYKLREQSEKQAAVEAMES